VIQDVEHGARKLPEIAWFMHALDNQRGHEIADEMMKFAEAAGFPVKPVITWAQLGEFEELTLNKVREWSIEHPGATVFYNHTKGAFHVFEGTEAWVDWLMDRLVGAWPPRVKELERYDTTGLHYITQAEFGPEVAADEYYAGNFWWATTDYLSTLPELPKLTEATRHFAEAWIGSKNPRWKALATGWPNPIVVKSAVD
jgi:hypothetical protein